MLDEYLQELIASKVEAAIAPLRAKIMELEKPAPEWMTGKEVAAYLKIRYNGVSEMVYDGRLKRYNISKTGKQYRYRRSQVETLFEAKSKKADSMPAVAITTGITRTKSPFDRRKSV